MKNKKHNIIFSFLFILSFGLLFIPHAEGAEIFGTPEKIEARVGDEFEISWFLNTDGVGVNALQGKILYLPDSLTVKEIRLGGSLINFWIERPVVDEKSGSITFSGILPGGFLGEKAPIFSIVFEAKKEGVFPLGFRDISAFLNDGEGTALETKFSGGDILVRGFAGENPSRAPSAVYDIFMPEPFMPFIARDTHLFRGQYALFFTTRDADSGIAYYEVCEGRRVCVRAESPYLLKNQNLTDEIAVKAYDMNGNRRIAMLPPTAQKKVYMFGPFSFEISLPILVLLVLIKVKQLLVQSRSLAD
jgi:hypothetical protein